MPTLEGPSVTFLVVDDRPENLLALEALLRRDGLEIVLARSGREALEILLVRDVGLAIIDVQMPEMDGFELAELMRGMARSRSIPIMFVTAGIHDAARVFEGYDAGAVDFLHKPIEPRILKNKADTFFRLDLQRRQLEDTLRFHETFVAAVGHDLRSPMNAITMAGQVLSMSASNDEQREVATRLVRGCERMMRMIDQLFDLSRSRLGGGFEVDRAKGDLLTAVRAAMEEHPSTEVSLRHEGDTKGYWDNARMARVVSNLLRNAAAHGAPGGPISMDVVADDEGVVLEVHNEGAIPAEVCETLFDPFAKRASRKGKEGLGLGLYIIDQIVRAHGGRVSVASSDACGTTFSVRIPKAGYERR